MSCAKPFRERPTPDRVALAIGLAARAHGVSVREILGRRRTRKVSFARFEAMARIRALNFNGRTPSLPQIGAWLGRDHTSVLNGLRRHAELSAEAGA